MDEALHRARHALSHFNLGPEIELERNVSQGQSNSTWSFRSGSSEFILKHHIGYHDLRHIQAEHHLLAWLTDQHLSFAVPAPVTTTSGKSLAVIDDGWFSVQRRIIGTQIDVHDFGQVLAFGATLGELLNVLAKYRPPRSIERALRNVMFPIEFVAVPWQALVNEACRPQPFATDPYAWLASEYDAIELMLAPHQSGLRTQITHGDYVPSNVLWADGSISGVLDFECASMQYAALDCAMALLFIVRYWTGQDSEATITTFGNGFRSSTELRDAEILALPGLMRLQLLASTTWWLSLAHSRRFPAEELCLRLERARDHADWIHRNADLIQSGMHG